MQLLNRKVDATLLWGLIPIIIVALYGAFSFYGLTSLMSNNAWVEHTHRAIAAANEIEKLAIDLETGERGFLITGRDEFLEPYNVAEGRMFRKISETKTLVSDNPSQVAKLNEVEKLVERWLSEVARVAIEIRRRALQGEEVSIQLQQRIEKATGKQILDRIRENLDELDLVFETANHQQARILVLAIAKNLVDKETGQRGFLLTGREEFLEPYNAGQSLLEANINELHNIIDADYDRQLMLKDIALLEQMAAEWSEQAAEPEIALRREVANGEKSSQELVRVLAMGQGKDILDRIRAHADDMSARFLHAGNRAADKLLLAVVKNMVDQETGQRGFLITGRDEFLEPYRSGQQQLALNIKALRELVERAYDPNHARRLLTRVADSARLWDERAGDPEISVRRQMRDHSTGLDDVVRLIETGAGKS